MDNLVPILTDGLIDVCKNTPEDPVDHLVSFLLTFLRLNIYSEDLWMFLTQTLQLTEFKLTFIKLKI